MQMRGSAVGMGMVGLALLGVTALSACGAGAAGAGADGSAATPSAPLEPTGPRPLPNAIGPVIIGIDDPALSGAGTVEVRRGQSIVLAVPEGTEAQWSATVDRPDVVRFTSGGDRGGWVARPGLDALEAGSAQVEIAGPGDQDLALDVIVVEPDPTATGDPGDPGAPSDPTVPGVPTDPALQFPPALTALLRDLVGMSEADALTAIEAAGGSSRVIERDGESFPVTMDFRTDRVNLTIVDGTVTRADLG